MLVSKSLGQRLHPLHKFIRKCRARPLSRECGGKHEFFVFRPTPNRSLPPGNNRLFDSHGAIQIDGELFIAEIVERCIPWLKSLHDLPESVRFGDLNDWRDLNEWSVLTITHEVTCLSYNAEPQNFGSGRVQACFERLGTFGG